MRGLVGLFAFAELIRKDATHGRVIPENRLLFEQGTAESVPHLLPVYAHRIVVETIDGKRALNMEDFWIASKHLHPTVPVFVVGQFLVETDAIFTEQPPVEEKAMYGYAELGFPSCCDVVQRPLHCEARGREVVTRGRLCYVVPWAIAVIRISDR